MNKPGVSKGGQMILVCDQDWFHPHAYVHHHKMWDKPTGFTEGINEVRTIIGKLNDMIIGDGDKNVYKIFTKQPVITWDNYFSGNTIFDYARIKGFGLLMTMRRDMLLKGVPPQYLHKKLTDPGNSAAK
eukprot:12678488-Ditylum_brightwellii.AAC.1